MYATVQEGRSSGRIQICSNRDFDFLYRGLERQELLIQRCQSCGSLRNPPCPACPTCHSFEWNAIPLIGRGILYSYTTHYHPPLRGFTIPLSIALAEMEEGARFVGPVSPESVSRMEIGAPLRVEFVSRDGVAGLQFVID
jgi:uncharacterized OB-fold protein